MSADVRECAKQRFREFLKISPDNWHWNETYFWPQKMASSDLWQPGLPQSPLSWKFEKWKAPKIRKNKAHAI
jgi:hypothetical protein